MARRYNAKLVQHRSLTNNMTQARTIPIIMHTLGGYHTFSYKYILNLEREAARNRNGEESNTPRIGMFQIAASLISGTAVTMISLQQYLSKSGGLRIINR